MVRARHESAAAPYHLMAKPIGPQCNLRCDYCFYLEKTGLYPAKRAADFRMSDATLETFVQRHIAARARGQREVHFAWQGGEPTMMGLAFFERVVELQRRHAPPGVTISNAFQTNGVLLTDDFARFFRDHAFLVGVSVDGPQPLHDRFRRHGSGEGSFAAVMAGIERLRRHGAEYNLLTVVQSDNGREPKTVYRFLKGLGTPFIQFIPIVEPAPGGGASERSIGGDEWGRFLLGVFHEWRSGDIGRMYVQHFDMMLGLTPGMPASVCVHAPRCGRALAIEHNGDVYACDHFVDREHRLGNIESRSLAEMVESPAQRKFGLAKSDTLPDRCKRCDYLRFCHGGCPKDRLIPTDSGPLNWLCSGYEAFYRESAPYFEAMAEAHRRQLPAAEYRRFLADPVTGRDGSAPP